MGQSNLESPPTFNALFRGASERDEEIALLALGRKACAKHWIEIRRVLDEATRFRRQRLYWAKRPTTRAGQGRIAFDREVRAARQALGRVIRHFARPWRPAELPAARLVLRELSRGRGAPPVLLDPETGEQIHLRAGRGPGLEFVRAVEKLCALGMTRDGAHAVLRCVGYTEIRLSPEPDFGGLED